MNKNLRTKALLVSLGLLAGVALSESVLYVAHRHPYPRSPGANARYTITTNEFTHVVQTNRLNFRGEEFVARAPGQVRIVAVGDSFAFGLGVEIDGAYPSVLEKNLRDAGMTDAYVVNAGWRASFPGAAYRLLEQYDEIFDPDVVMLQVYIGNDLYDAMGQDELDRRVEVAAEERRLDRESFLRRASDAICPHVASPASEPHGYSRV